MGIFDILKKPSTQQKVNKAVQVKITSPEEMNKTNRIIPIEERISGEQPTCDGLFTHEVLVLNYASSFLANGENSQANFWWYRYGIKDLMKVVTSLKDRGLIQIGSVKDAASMEQYSVIKDELKKRGIKSSGKKAELIDRLFGTVSEEELKNVFPNKPYVLTAQGEAILKKYEWIPFIHNHNYEGLDIWNLTRIVQQPPYIPYRDKIWGYLNERCSDLMKENDFGLYRNCRYVMSEFVADEGKKTIAFKLLCEVVAYDLSGLSNGFKMEYMEIYSKYFFPYEDSNYKMAPAITEKIKEYRNEFGWSEEELRQHLLEGISRIELPFRLFTNDECVDIVMAETHANIEQLHSIYQKAEIRFTKQYKFK